MAGTAGVAAVIEELRISDLGVIDEAVLELGPGLTVLTGETGAGKTMVVTALGLLLGGRGDAGAVRAGRPRAVVEGRVLAPDAVVRRAEEAGAVLDDETLILARTVTAEGRSRAHVGGRQAPVGLLAELGEELVSVHGQSDQQRLLRPSRQREALDRYAGPAVLEPLASYRDVFGELREAERELAELTTRARERAEEADLLRGGLAEVERVAPEAGEDLRLAEESERLGHAGELVAAARAAHDLLTGGGEEGADAGTLVGLARQTLEQAAGYDPRLADLARRVAEVSYLLADASADLSGYAEGVDADPARLAAVEERRAQLFVLTRRYGGSVEEVLAWASRAGLRLVELDSDDERIAELRARQEALGRRVRALAEEVSSARRAAAEAFAEQVSAELAALAMPQARLTVDVTSVDAAELSRYGPEGIDTVELRLAAHQGAPMRPIAAGASGGELSRVMLAVEVVLAGADPVPTAVFDEVDAGVGGRAAVEVGARLARLAQTAQVLVVTHLPQVAAYADAHLLVEKDASDGRTRVVVLEGEARVAELTRMLAGLEGSRTGAAHARELLDAAAALKGGSPRR
ncbi:MAG TPA: DNA repair protein RecN [Actinomycetes bacterium]|nr:DNA repair protein RecN [Actinomycetes bacterium]